MFLIDSKYGFAGTPDLICNIDGKLWIIDFKTGGNYKTHNLQCRMYALLYEAIFGKKVDVIAGMYTDDSLPTMVVWSSSVTVPWPAIIDHRSFRL